MVQNRLCEPIITTVINISLPTCIFDFWNLVIIIMDIVFLSHINFYTITIFQKYETKALYSESTFRNQIILLKSEV